MALDLPQNRKDSFCRLLPASKTLRFRVVGINKLPCVSSIGKKRVDGRFTVDQASVGGRTRVSPVQGCADETATRPRASHSRTGFPPGLPALLPNSKIGMKWCLS